MKKDGGAKHGIKQPKDARKLFFSGVVILTASNIIIKAIGLLFKIPMNHVVGDTGMGYYTSAYTIYTLLYMISTAGLPVALSKMISESRAKGRIRESRRIFSVSMILFLIIGAVATAAMFISAKWYSREFIGAPPTYVCIYTIAPTLLFVCITSAYRGYFQGYQQMIPTAVSQVIESFCKLALGVGAAMYAIKMGYEIHIVAAFAAIGLTVGVILGTLFLAVYKLFFNEKPYNEEYVALLGESELSESSSVILGRLVKIAIPITLSASVMSLSNLIDAVLVQRLLQSTGMTQEAATTLYGNYTTLAVPMFNLPAVLVTPIAYSIIPLISVSNGNGNEKRSRTAIESSLGMAVLIGLPCAIGLATLAGPILKLFFVSSSAELATPLLMLLAPSALFLCILTVTNAVLQANGFEKRPLISMAVGGVLKVASNYLLIGKLGMAATPVSTFICYLAATVLNFVFVVRDVGVTPNFSKVFWRPLGAGVICGATAFFSHLLLASLIHEKIATVIAIMLAAAAYGIGIILLKVITEEDLKIVPKGEKIAKMLKKMGILS